MQGGKFLRSSLQYLINERKQGLRKLANIEAVNHIIGGKESSTVKAHGKQNPIQQGEIRLNHNPYQNPNIDQEQDGEYVPEIFRQNRHKYSTRPTEIGGYKRQIIYRSVHIGTKELEIVLGDWLSINIDKLSYADLIEFDQNVLDIENPSLQRYLMNGEDLLPQHNNKYMNILMEYVQARKVDYFGNIPKSPLY